jgi:hypothetical protein
MRRVSFNRRTAEALRKTLRQLESDPSIDPQEPAFIQLKCGLLQCLMNLEVDTAEIRSTLHLVEPPQHQPATSEADAEPDSAIA